MWTGVLLTYCFLAPTGDIECHSEAPIALVDPPAVYRTETECQIWMLRSAVASAFKGMMPVVSLRATCQQESV